MEEGRLNTVCSPSVTVIADCQLAIADWFNPFLKAHTGPKEYLVLTVESIGNWQSAITFTVGITARF